MSDFRFSEKFNFHQGSYSRPDSGSWGRNSASDRWRLKRRDFVGHHYVPATPKHTGRVDTIFEYMKIYLKVMR
jgi:hypothetical protein